MTDRQTADRFYRELWPLRQKVLRTARYLAGSAFEADDLAQEALMKAYKAIGTLSPGSNVQGWLMTILRNTWIDHGRRRTEPVSIEAEGIDLPAAPEIAEPSQTTPAALIESLSDEKLAAAVRQLPEEIRWTVLLLYVEQMEEQAVAEMLDIPVGTVKSRAFRGRAMLRKSLAPAATRQLNRDQPEGAP